MNNPGVSLYLIPTILADGTQNEVLSPQIRAVVQHLDVFFVENVRTARRFISSLKLGKVIDELTFIELNKDTPEADTAASLRKLSKNAGIISEAGCPGVADPGAVAVRMAHELGIKVVPLVGPSSILLRSGRASTRRDAEAMPSVTRTCFPTSSPSAITASARSSWRASSASASPTSRPGRCATRMPCSART